MDSLTAYRSVIEKIAQATRSSKTRNEIELIVVSKTQTLENILSVYHLGQRIFGENYVQELLDKRAALKHQNILDLDFHFIGHLQTNKVKLLLPEVTTIHSIDSVKLLEEVEKRASDLNKKIKIYIQVNIDQEDSKNGFSVDELDSVSSRVSNLRHISSLGLMAIPNPSLNSNESFQKLAQISLKYRKVLGSGLSMGMSEDFEDAIACGATSIRVGSAIFGARK